MSNRPKSKNPTTTTDAEAAAPEAATETPEPRRVTVYDQEYTVDPVALDDFELLEDLNDFAETHNSVRLPSVLRRLLGSEQMKVAMDAIRDPDTGRVTVDAGTDFVGELIGALNPNS